MKVSESARLIVLDERQRVLFFKYEDAIALDPFRPELLVYWVTPGGRLEAGETFEEAARREIWEETGLQDLEIGPLIWKREREFVVKGEPLFSRERCFLVRIKSHEVSLENLQAEESITYRGHGWWSVEEMCASSEIFLPPGVIDILERIIAGQIPAEPLFLVD